jgi:ribosomal protein S18 acetylase RimI-like enzyme
MPELYSAIESHLDDLIELVGTTGCYRKVVQQNKLGLGYRDFMIRFVIPPLMKYSSVLIDNTREGRVIGALICGLKKDFDRDHVPWGHHLSDAVLDEISIPLRNLKIQDGFFIHSMAIGRDMQGRGFGKKLFLEAESVARQLNCAEDLSLTVWSNNVKAVRFYLSMSMIVTDIAQVNLPCFPPLLLMQNSNQFISYPDLCA